MRRVVYLSVALLVGGSAYLFGWSDLFPVKQILINESDKSIARELKLKLDESPKAILIGQPIARVDKRVITSRLQSLIWVDEVEIKRDFLKGDVTISVSPRSAIARLSGKSESPASDFAFLGSELEVFYVSKDAVEKAARTGDTNWLKLPTLSLADGTIGEGGDRAILQDVRTLMESIVSFGGEVKEIRAPERDSLATVISLTEGELDISWGSVNELELKFEILERLLDLKANKNVKRVDLSNPISPIVSNNR